MYYGIYKNVRNSAWQCLNDFNISTLPIDIASIAKTSGIRIIKNSSVWLLEDNENGRSLYINGVWHIVYNDSSPTAMTRYTIAHELGHILLGHETATVKYTNTKSFKTSSSAEDQADMFAKRLLCPACVIWALELSSAEEIAKYFYVDIDTATERCKRIKVLNKRGKYLTDDLERQVFEHFRDYIEDERKKRGISSEHNSRFANL